MNPLNSSQSSFYITTGGIPSLVPTTATSILKTSTAPSMAGLITNPAITSVNSGQQTTTIMEANKFVTTANYVPVLLTNQTLITNIDPMQQQQQQQQTQNFSSSAMVNVTTNSPVVAGTNISLISANKQSPVVMATNHAAGNITYQVLSPPAQNLGTVLAAQNGVSVLLTAPTTMATSGHVAAAPFLIRNTPTAVTNVTTATQIKQQQQPAPPAQQQLQLQQQQHLLQQQLLSQTFNTQQLNPEILKQIVVGNSPTPQTNTSFAPGTTLLKSSLLQSKPSIPTSIASRQFKIPNKTKNVSSQQQLNSQSLNVSYDTSSGKMFTTFCAELSNTSQALNNSITAGHVTQAIQKLPQVSLLQNSKNQQALYAPLTNTTFTNATAVVDITSEQINEIPLGLTKPNEVRLGNLNAEVSLIKKPTNSEKSKEMSLLKASQEQQEVSLLKANKEEVTFKVAARTATKVPDKSETTSLLKTTCDFKNSSENLIEKLYNSKTTTTFSNSYINLNDITFNEKQESLLKSRNYNSNHTSPTTSPRTQRSKSCNTGLKSNQIQTIPANANERRHSEPIELVMLGELKIDDIKSLNKLNSSKALEPITDVFEEQEYVESSGKKTDANLDGQPIKKETSAFPPDEQTENKMPMKAQERQDEAKNPEQSKQTDSDSDDDVTILPVDESFSEPIEIDDDDDEEAEADTVTASCHSESVTSKENSPTTKNKEKLNESLLLCDEQVLISSSSSISNQSLDQLTSSFNVPTNKQKIETSATKTEISKTPLLKKSLTERKPPIVVKEESSNGYSAVLDMLSNFNMLNWRERVGAARGTKLKFQLNDFNLIQVHEKVPMRNMPHTNYEKPLYERDNLHSWAENGEPMIYYECRRCHVRASALDFLAPEFCSVYCLKRDYKKRCRRDEATNTQLRKKARYVVDASPSNVNNNPPPLTYITTPKFRWSSYLKANYNFIAAPISLFPNPFPTGPNNFKVGMKLEAIDPENCALFCVCTVVDINGYRLKLSFDGYDSCYDFWLNADSMDIFPPGWCAKTNRILQAPKGYNSSRFNWPTYLNKEKANPAPRQLFTHLNSSSLIPMNPFEIGMHLEAEDLNDTGKLCVASVADVLDDRIRIHFDGWDDCYDIIVDINSPYIHPCGWHVGKQQLVVPPDCENSAFSWDNYVRKKGKGLAAANSLFVAREAINFKPNMKLEVVDPRNPSLIRPATVVSHKGHRVKLHLDAWPTDYCFWLEDDSPDLHPIGWCDATGHDLEPPPGFQMAKQKMPCPIPGCRGIGNSKKSFMNVHATRECCPYAPENWRIVMDKPPRVGFDDIVRHVSKPKPPVTFPTPTQKRLSEQQLMERLQMMDNLKARNVLIQQDKVAKELIGYSLSNVKKEELKETKQNKPSTSISAVSNLPQKSDSDASLDVNLAIAKEFLCDYGPRLQQNYTLWQKNFTFDTDKINRNPMLWSVSDVTHYVDLYLHCKKTTALFAQEEIDGAAFLLLQQDDLTDRLGLKIGPALKLYSAILQLRTLAVTKFNVAYRKAVT